MLDRAAVALAFASAAFVSVPASLIPQSARAQDGRRRVDAGRRVPTSPRQTACTIPGPRSSGCLTVSGYARWQTIDIGNGIGTATVIKKGDPFFASSPSILDGGQLGKTLSFTTGDWAHALGGSFTWANQNSKADEPAGGNDIGYVPGEEQLGNGWNFGDFGSTANSKLDYRRFDLHYNATRAFHFNTGPAWGPGGPNDAVQQRAGLATSLRFSDLDHNGHLNTDFSQDYSVDVNQQLSSAEFGIGPAVSGKWDLGSGFYVWGGANAQIILRHSELTSDEKICFPCGMGNNAIWSKIDDTKNTVDGRLTFQAAVGRQINENLAVKIGGGVELGGRDVYDIRKSPNEKSTHIARNSYADWNAGLVVHYRFGAR